MYPLWNQPGKLIEQFGKATNKDADFDKVLQAANANFDADDKNSNEFGTLYEAVEASGLVLTNYNFPKMTFRGQVPDNRLVLQKLQKQVAGQIQLGLDLRGGSSFLVAIDTNKLENAAAGGALASRRAAHAARGAARPPRSRRPPTWQRAPSIPRQRATALLAAEDRAERAERPRQRLARPSGAHFWSQDRKPILRRPPPALQWMAANGLGRGAGRPSRRADTASAPTGRDTSIWDRDTRRARR